MGISYSGKKSYYLHEYVNPRVEHKSTELSLRYNIRGDTLIPEKALFLKDMPLKSKLFSKSLLNSNEKCLILGINQLYLQNDSKCDITLYIENLFPIKEENRDNNNNNNHPDDSGLIKFVVPKGCRKVIEKDSQLLYEPKNIKNPNILRYAGMEEVILKPRTVVLEGNNTNNNEEIFKESDPVVDFMIQYLDEIDGITAADLKEISPLEIGGTTKYKISPDALEKVRAFFKDAVFDIFKYSDLKETKVMWDKLKGVEKEDDDDSIIFIILRLEYLVISPNSQSVFQKRTSELKGL